MSGKHFNLDDEMPVYREKPLSFYGYSKLFMRDRCIYPYYNAPRVKFQPKLKRISSESVFPQLRK